MFIASLVRLGSFPIFKLVDIGGGCHFRDAAGTGHQKLAVVRQKMYPTGMVVMSVCE